MGIIRWYGIIRWGVSDDMGLSDDIRLSKNQMIWDYQMIWDCQMIWGYQITWYRNALDYMMCLLCYAFKSGQVIWAQKEPMNFLVMLCNLPSLLIILTYPHLHNHMDRTWNHAIYRDHVLPTTPVILYDRSQRADRWCQATVAMLKEAGAGMVSFKAGDHQVVPPPKWMVP